MCVCVFSLLLLLAGRSLGRGRSPRAFLKTRNPKRDYHFELHEDEKLRCIEIKRHTQAHTAGGWPSGPKPMSTQLVTAHVLCVYVCVRVCACVCVSERHRERI